MHAYMAGPRVVPRDRPGHPRLPPTSPLLQGHSGHRTSASPPPHTAPARCAPALLRTALGGPLACWDGQALWRGGALTRCAQVSRCRQRSRLLVWRAVGGGWLGDCTCCVGVVCDMDGMAEQAVLLQRISHALWTTSDGGSKMVALALQVICTRLASSLDPVIPNSTALALHR